MDSPHLVYGVLYVSSPRGKRGVRFLCTFALLNKHIPVKSMVGMGSNGVGYNRPPPPSRKGYNRLSRVMI
jgi:hypothetical protein